jgi:asparagine synthetase B (glutamine-hydrolysing)
VTLAIDQVGYKTIYYAVLHDRFAFASEYKSLLALADFPPESDRAAIQHYLATKYPMGRRSFLARARQLARPQKHHRPRLPTAAS